MSDDPNASPSPPERRRREPRRTVRLALLSREERIEEALRRLLRYKGQYKALRSDIESALDRMSEQAETWKRIRRKLDLGAAKEFAERCGSVLPKVIDLMREMPASFNAWPLAFTPEPFVINGESTYRGFHREQFLRQLRLLHRMCERWQDAELSRREQKAHVDDMRIAAYAAVFLCEKYLIKPALTEEGRFCRLAAALYGDPAVHFRPHCKWARDERSKHLKVSKQLEERARKKQPVK